MTGEFLDKVIDLEQDIYVLSEKLLSMLQGLADTKYRTKAIRLLNECYKFAQLAIYKTMDASLEEWQTSVIKKCNKSIMDKKREQLNHYFGEETTC